MSTLQDRLGRIKAAFVQQAPEQARDIMARATDDLRNSGILDRIPSPGDVLQPFELPDTSGELVRSEELLGEGTLVLSVYRGVW